MSKSLEAQPNILYNKVIYPTMFGKQFGKKFGSLENIRTFVVEINGQKQ